jgi:putative membrane protein
MRRLNGSHIFATSFLIALGGVRHAFAHETGEHAEGTAVHPANWHELARDWSVEPYVTVGLTLIAILYVAGLSRMWRGGVARGIRKWEVACYAGGWLSLVIALVSPLHPWGGVLFSAHMTQHEILMLISAPLIALGRPMLAFLRALPRYWAGSLARAAHSNAWADMWRLLTHPFVAWLIHSLTLWLWHVPFLFDATQHSEVVHALQHISFLFTAILFWWAIIQTKGAALRYGTAILYLFTTAIHSSLLGVLITVARKPWYDSYAHTTAAWGFTQLEDQQLGGLIMWIPAGVVYIVAGLAFTVGWLREAERRSNDRERKPLAATSGALE